MAYLDRDRAARLMAAAGLDALLLFTPESFAYATGASPGVGTMWRRAGAVAAIVPADPGVPVGAVVSDLFAANFRASSDVTDIRIHPLWVETADVRSQDRPQPLPELIAAAWADSGRPVGFARPETFDAALGFRLAGDLLAARKLGGARVGVELDSLSVLDFAQVSAALPGCQLLDGSDVLRQLKMVKSAQEIGHLRTAVTLAEIGIGALAAAIAPGQTRDALADVWTRPCRLRRGKGISAI